MTLDLVTWLVQASPAVMGWVLVGAAGETRKPRGPERSNEGHLCELWTCCLATCVPSAFFSGTVP